MFSVIHTVYVELFAPGIVLHLFLTHVLLKLTAKLLKQGYRYHKLRKAFLSFIADTVSWLKNIMLA